MTKFFEELKKNFVFDHFGPTLHIFGEKKNFLEKFDPSSF